MLVRLSVLSHPLPFSTSHSRRVIYSFCFPLFPLQCLATFPSTHSNEHKTNPNPSPDTLKSLLGPSASSVSSIGISDFDPRGQYKKVVDAVKNAAGKGSTLKVFKVELDGTRSEIWVVGLDGQGTRIVGLKALVVET